MNKIETKLLLCLADPELTDSEFKQFIDLLYRRDFRELISAADHLRHVGRDILKQISRSRLPDGFVKHIQEILLKEGRMKPSDAVRSLLMELRAEPIPSRKWTIRSGLEFALQFASETEILAAAQRALAKRSSTGNKHAWSLKRPAA